MSQSSIPAPTVPLATKAGVVSPQWYIFWAGLQAQGASDTTTSTTLALEGLSDVSVGGKVTGSVLTWNASLGKWVAGSSGTSGVKINSTQVQSFTTQGILRFAGSQLSAYLAVGQGTITNYNVGTIVLSGSGGTLSSNGSMAAVGISIPGVEFGTLQVNTITTGGMTSATLVGANLYLGSHLSMSEGSFSNSLVTGQTFVGGGVTLSGTGSLGTIAIPGVNFGGTQVAGLAAEGMLSGTLVGGTLSLNSELGVTINSTLVSPTITSLQIKTGQTATSASFSGSALVLNLGTP